MSTEYLKDSYKWHIRTFTLFNAALFWTLAVSGEDVSTLPTFFSAISVKDGLVASIAPIICFLIDGFLSAEAKARLVYWRWHHPLPGSRAFSKHLEADPRADPEKLARDWGQLSGQPVQTKPTTSVVGLRPQIESRAPAFEVPPRCRHIDRR